ncbi:hypothetical protein GGS20DRAFT_388483 [Poronia punctata]|nr:hypothetical protein GGS20DRAFT_388483 [Poronia punctata]
MDDGPSTPVRRIPIEIANKPSLSNPRLMTIFVVCDSYTTRLQRARVALELIREKHIRSDIFGVDAFKNSMSEVERIVVTEAEGLVKNNLPLQDTFNRSLKAMLADTSDPITQLGGWEYLDLLWTVLDDIGSDLEDYKELVLRRAVMNKEKKEGGESFSDRLARRSQGQYSGSASFRPSPLRQATGVDDRTLDDIMADEGGNALKKSADADSYWGP